MSSPAHVGSGLLHATALAALTSGQVAEARRLVADALEDRELDLLDRAELVRLRARLSTWSGPIRADAWAEVVHVAELVTGTAPELAAAMLCDAAVLAAFTRQLPLCEQLSRRALELTGGAGPTGALAATGLGLAYGLVGRAEEAAPLLARAADLLEADAGIADAAQLLLPGVLALMVQERHDEAVAAAARFLATARSLGAIGLLPLPLCLLAHAGWKAARWEEARVAAAEAATLARGTGETALELYATAMLALVAGGQGREQVCRERVEHATRLADETGVGMFRVTVQAALVHLSLGLDQPERALAPLAEIETLMGTERRVGMLNWHSDAVDVLVQLDRREEAAARLRVLERDAPTSRWESAALLRCRGQLATGDQAVPLLEAAVEAFAFQPYEQARTRLRLAQRLAAAGDAAAARHAAHAQQTFAVLRAQGWAAQAAALASAAPPELVHRRRATDQRPASAATPTLEVRLLGGFTVLHAGEPVTPPPGMGAQAVKFVAVAGGRATVDHLVEALWPEAEPGRGRTRLRNVLARLRQDVELLVRDGDEVALADGAVCDLTLFLDEAAQALGGTAGSAVARRAVERYAGELLPGDRYQDWTAGPRERARAHYLRLLDRLAAAETDVDQAVAWYERALDVDPYDEERYVAMAQLLVQQGRAGPAHRVVRRALAMVDRLGVPPSAALVALTDAVGA